MKMIIKMSATEANAITGTLLNIVELTGNDKRKNAERQIAKCREKLFSNTHRTGEASTPIPGGTATVRHTPTTSETDGTYEFELDLERKLIDWACSAAARCVSLLMPLILAIVNIVNVKRFMDGNKVGDAFDKLGDEFNAMFVPKSTYAPTSLWVDGFKAAAVIVVERNGLTGKDRIVMIKRVNGSAMMSREQAQIVYEMNQASDPDKCDISGRSVHLHDNDFTYDSKDAAIDAALDILPGLQSDFDDIYNA